jgi:hypothetical protein
MAAVNLELLKTQVAELLEVLEEPVELKDRCLALLDFYADRTRRALPDQEASKATGIFGVPKPVMRVLSYNLYDSVAKRPKLAQQIATTLWEEGFRETRQLASALLVIQEMSEILNQTRSWVLECDDRHVLRTLADQGLATTRREYVPSFLNEVGKWLSSPHKQLRLFALLALRYAVEDPEFEDLPTVFRILAGIIGRVRGESRQALVDLVNALAQRSPPETTRFLLDEKKRKTRGVERLIRETMTNFPPHQHSVLKRSLSHKNRTGIITSIKIND